VSRRLRFRGESRHKVDGKGRVSIPAKFCRVLEAGDPDWVDGLSPNFVMVYGNPAFNCIECYTVEEIVRIEEGIDAMKHGPKREALEEIYSTYSADATIDDTGRIVIPAKLRERFGIANEAMIVSSLNSFRIWEPAAYEAEKRQRDEQLRAELPRNPLQWLGEDDEVA
jgi:MraZ protein